MIFGDALAVAVENRLRGGLNKLIEIDVSKRAILDVLDVSADLIIEIIQSFFAALVLGARDFQLAVCLCVCSLSFGPLGIMVAQTRCDPLSYQNEGDL